MGERCPDVELFEGERLIAGALCCAGVVTGVASCVELLNTIMSFGFGGTACGATMAVEPLPYFGAGAVGADEAQPVMTKDEKVSPTSASLRCAEVKVMPLHTSNVREVFPFHWK